MSRVILLAALAVLPIVHSDCSNCCVPPDSPAAKTARAVTCDGCQETAMQIGCLLDKASALCETVGQLGKCVAYSTPAQRSLCALAHARDMIMGTGPDNGDMGVFDDYQSCCDTVALSPESSE